MNILYAIICNVAAIGLCILAVTCASLGGLWCAAMIRAMFKRWRARRALRAHTDGYNWAMHELRGGRPPRYIADLCGSVDHNFDRGASAALHDWRCRVPQCSAR
jgi:hypothetical protein